MGDSRDPDQSCGKKERRFADGAGNEALGNPEWKCVPCERGGRTSLLTGVRTRRGIGTRPRPQGLIWPLFQFGVSEPSHSQVGPESLGPCYLLGATPSLCFLLLWEKRDEVV